MLQCRHEIFQEAARGRAVHRAVIVGERKPHRGVSRDLAFHRADALGDAVDAEQRNLRRVDDGRKALDAKQAEVADRKRAALQQIGIDAAVDGLLKM